jgi:uncharacterized protein YyaL (SSP411 family)
MTAQQHSSEFHFSPRPNRASEIRWQTWGDNAFERAKAEDKPILLAISAVWCHWCHVMDETSYSDDGVIAAINQNFVPVRVDNDRRPDVNARYNQGGWPTTAFLTPDGSLLAGATYLPAEQMRTALEQIADFYQKNRGEIEKRAVELKARERDYVPAPPSELNGGMIARIFGEIEEQYDPEYGGFGNAPKFPMVDALEFLLQEYRAAGSQRAYDMLAHTMLGMADGGMYDHAEGGFFRYSTTRDWSVPHFEKMTEDHAGLLRVLAGLTRATRNVRFRNTLLSAIGYVRAVLRDPQTSFFAGSQDADEAYYALPLEERREHRAPYVDRTSYSNWTAAMAGTFVLAGTALEDDRILEEGCAALDGLHERMRDNTGLLYHFIEPNGTPQIRGLLTDQSAYLRALIDGHESTGEARFLERAREIAAAIERYFAAPDGGYYDHAEIENPLGNLTLRDRPRPENAVIAESLLRLAVLDEEPRYREQAERALVLYAKTFDRAGIFASAFARALRRYLSTPSSAVVVGGVEQTADLREAAAHLPDALLSIRTIDPRDAATLQRRGFDASLQPAAYVCSGQTCAAPARTPADVRTAYESLASR